jgi:hypothetical protein
METKSREGAQEASGEASQTRDEPRVDGYLMAAFPWYGLDETYPGPRWLMQVGTSADGTVEHGSLGHGDEPTRNLEDYDNRRFAVCVTVSSRPVRKSADGTGMLEATSAASAAWLAGSGLLTCTWPARMDRALRQDWLEQQTAIAWELADDLGGQGWTSLTLPVDGEPAPFHYRESEYGWVLAGEARGVHLGAYGRGISAYSLGFGVVADISTYSDRY